MCFERLTIRHVTLSVASSGFSSPPLFPSHFYPLQSNPCAFYIHGIQSRFLADIDSEPNMNDSPTHSTISSDDSSGTVPRLMPALYTENRPGFPTYAQYKDVEASYLNNMSHMKRPKALITQAMFDDIWDVLHHPKAVTTGTPQFRYWVRKMFTLSRSKRDHPSPGTGPDAADNDTHTGQSPVVLHDGRPVAIMEHLYEVLCYCHGLAEHGGRDKTCTVIREHYSWVPKDLTARFVKACPTCVEKKNRSRELVAQFLEQPLVRKQDVDDMSICSRVENEEVDAMPICSRGEEKEADDMPICPPLPVTPRPRVPSIPQIPESPCKKVCRFDMENDCPTELRARGELFSPSDPFKVQDSFLGPTLRNASWLAPPPEDCGPATSKLPGVYAVNTRRDSFFSSVDAGNSLDGPLKPRFPRAVLCDISNVDNRKLNNSRSNIGKCVSPTQPLRVTKPVNLQPSMVSESCWYGFSHRNGRGLNNVAECYSPTLQLPKVAGSLHLQLPFVPEPCWNGASHVTLPNRTVFHDNIRENSVASSITFSNRTTLQDTVRESSVASPLTFSNRTICQDAIGDSSIVSPMTFSNRNISHDVHAESSVSRIGFSNTNASQYANGQEAPFTYSGHANHVDGAKARGQTPLFMDWMPSSVCGSQSSISSFASVGPLSPFDFDHLCPELALGTDISDGFSQWQAYSTERVLFH